MKQEENALWQKISLFKFDDEHSSFQFSDRLARENGWTKAYTFQVIEEYKKFIFLCCISKSGVTPSDQVDQAWHLHLTYTKSYWIDLCKHTLAREIHHTPTKGGGAESEKFDDFYSATLLQYKEKFGTQAPDKIWPQNAERFSNVNFQRINLKNYWLVRKLRLKKIHALFLLFLLVPFYVHAANSDEEAVNILLVVIIFGIIIYSFFFRNDDNGGTGGNGNSCSGSSDSSHDHGHGHGHSGCSGCSSSGCSGCGGGGD